jgi:hypothetical protein
MQKSFFLAKRCRQDGNAKMRLLLLEKMGVDSNIQAIVPFPSKFSKSKDNILTCALVRLSVMANRPVSSELTKYYYEITILTTEEENFLPNPYVTATTLMTIY